MAKSGAVWGIDLGQSALRALRCRINGDDKSKIQADAYDFVEYPTILGQPDADAATIIRDALKTFLSRNSVKDDQVAISTAGQNGLARFVKLPPVEEKKIPDIVRFEARQQIPFKLEEVVWDYQRLPGGSVEDGFALDAEVGLFAMKRDQVFKAIKPFEEVGIPVDYVQLAPLAILNCMRYDVLEAEIPQAIDPDNPPPWKVILSVGTDTTDVVMTNGFRIWQRSVPLGGNHFTKAITKTLKTTFSKAEHLKRNAQSIGPDDAKALFKAMRPVYGDMVTEVQTSLRYFTMNVEKTAEVDKIIALGNAMKLPGLRKFLEQNLEIAVVQPEGFQRLTGSSVISAPAFKDNILAFGTCYGLALQGLKQGLLKTNLVPQEVHRDRMIEEKKPWALAGAAALLLGFTINYGGEFMAWMGSRVTDDWQKKGAEAVTTKSTVDAINTDYDAAKKTLEDVDKKGRNLVQSVEGRLLWPEMLVALNKSLPSTPIPPEMKDQSVETVQPNISQRRDLHITTITATPMKQYERWFRGEVKKAWDLSAAGVAAAASAPASDQPPAEEPPPEDAAAAAAPVEEEQGVEINPALAGYRIRIEGHHFHNEGGAEGTGGTYVDNTLIKNLLNDSIDVFSPADGSTKKVRILDQGTIDAEGKRAGAIGLGIQKPVMTYKSQIETIPNPAIGKENQQNFTQPDTLRRFKFTLEFWWKPTTESDRQKALAAAAENPPAEADPAATASLTGTNNEVQ
jgi:type IV pilus assembly protein PilM